MVQPRQALNESGAETSIVSSPKNQCVCSLNFVNWSKEFPVDVPLDRANASDFDALLLPGGVTNPDALHMRPAAVAFVKSFFDAGKPVRSKPTCGMPAQSGLIRRS